MEVQITSGNEHNLIVCLNFKSLARNQPLAPIPLISAANITQSFSKIVLRFTEVLKVSFLLVLKYECLVCEGHFSLISRWTMDKYFEVIKDFFFFSFSYPKIFLLCGKLQCPFCMCE